MSRSFGTAYDKWLVGLVIAAVVVPWALLIVDARQTDVPVEVWWMVAGITLFVVTLMRVTAWPVRYEIDDELLRVRSGLITYRIVLGSIVRVEPTRSLISSPAWSLDRLRVVFLAGRGIETALMVSPADKAGFLRALEDACGRSLSGDA